MPDESHRGATRRELIAAAGASAVALSAGMGLAEPPVLASGFVFEGNGYRRPGDRGIPGVMVSNGTDVVLTDAEGRWRLPVSEGDSVFVIKPPQWSIACGPGGIPHCSYLHQTRGTPSDLQLWHGGIAPTGPLPVSIDFGLQRQAESSRFEALLLADTQPANDLELGYLRDDIIAGVLGTDAAFGINHGDVVFDDLALYPRYLQMLSATQIPWHHCPGNHDLNSEARDDAYSRETWKRVFGPRRHAFRYADATFILLDNVYYFGHNPGAQRSGQYCGLIGASQLQFVRNVLANVPRDQLIVLSMHIPLTTYANPENPADNTADHLALLDLLAGRPHTVSFSGHMHQTEHHYLACSSSGGTQRLHHHHVLTAASGGWWGGPRDRRGIPFADSVDGNPNGYHVLMVDGSGYETRFVPAIGKVVGQMRAVVCDLHGGRAASSAEPIAADRLLQCKLVVNVFDGGPRTSVAYEIAGHNSGPVPMNRVAAPDPFFVESFAKHASAQKAWVRPGTSSHLWEAPLQASLGAGVHRVTVRAVDEYGREQLSHVALEVSAHA